MTEIKIITNPTPEQLAPINRGLHDYNLAKLGKEMIDNYHKLAVTTQDDNGEVVGGVWGELYWEWLYIHTLWVKEPYGALAIVRSQEHAVRFDPSQLGEREVRYDDDLGALHLLLWIVGLEASNELALLVPKVYLEHVELVRLRMVLH